MIWATSIWKLGCSNRSKIHSAQKCYLCLRYVVSPMCPGRTLEIWWTRGDSNPRPPRCERGALPAELLAHEQQIDFSKGSAACQHAFHCSQIRRGAAPVSTRSGCCAPNTENVILRMAAYGCSTGSPARWATIF